MYSAERLVSGVNRIWTLTARYGSRSDTFQIKQNKRKMWQVNQQEKSWHFIRNDLYNRAASISRRQSLNSVHTWHKPFSWVHVLINHWKLHIVINKNGLEVLENIYAAQRLILMTGVDIIKTFSDGERWKPLSILLDLSSISFRYRLRFPRSQSLAEL